MVNLNNLFLIIEKNGLTASKVAADTGTSTGNISDWKNGRSMPSAMKLDVLADYFDCSVDYLLGRTNNPNFEKAVISPEEKVPRQNSYRIGLRSVHLMYDSQKIAYRIKSTTKQQSKSLGEVLSNCGLGKNTVSKIEKGTDILTLNFAKIADYLDCSVDYLLGRTDNPYFEKAIPPEEKVTKQDLQAMIDQLETLKNRIIE